MDNSNKEENAEYRAISTKGDRSRIGSDASVSSSLFKKILQQETGRKLSLSYEGQASINSNPKQKSDSNSKRKKMLNRTSTLVSEEE